MLAGASSEALARRLSNDGPIKTLTWSSALEDDDPIRLASDLRALANTDTDTAWKEAHNPSSLFVRGTSVSISPRTPSRVQQKVQAVAEQQLMVHPAFDTQTNNVLLTAPTEVQSAQ